MRHSRNILLALAVAALVAAPAVLSPSLADAAGPSLAAITIYLLMIVVLFWKPQGLFPAGS